MSANGMQAANPSVPHPRGTSTMEPVSPSFKIGGGGEPEPPSQAHLSSAHWLPHGDAAYDAMVRLIREARRDIRLESYAFQRPGPGLRILDALHQALQRGVRVRVLVDAFGSESLPVDFFDDLRRLGAECRVFNPRPALRLSFRNHRKLLVCDDAAIVGGFNIGPEYEGDGIVRGWYDLGLQLDGPIVVELAHSFDAMFDLAPFTAQTLREFAIRRRNQPPSPGPIQLLTSGAACPRQELRRELHRDLRRARDVRIMAAYFLPPRRIRQEFTRCVRRGGRVQLLLAGRTDVPMSKLAGEHLYGELLDRGVEIYEFQPQVLHAKLIVMDDVVYVGSCNLDKRSLLINYELLLRLEWPALADEARQMFTEALGHSSPVHQGCWRNGRLWQRVQRRLAYWLLARVDPLVTHRKLKYLV